MRNIIFVALLLLAAFIAACDSSNSVTPEDGKISGSITVDGPFNGAVELLVGLFEGETLVESATAGRLTSTATATLNGRAIAFSFTEVEFGTYSVRLYSTSAGTNTYYYTSDPITLSASNSEVTNFSEHASFTGEGPFGSISGVALLSDDFEFPGAGQLTFFGFSPVSDPQNAYQWIVASGDASNGQLFYSVDGIAHGTWIVGLYGYNPQTHAVTVFGMLDEPVVVNAGTPDVTGAVFAADSDGDPGDDPDLGTINGTITFNGALPAGQSIWVAANTVPPQQGAPPAVQEVTSIDGRTFDYSLPLLPNGEYSISIFSYDMANHQAIYFGDYDGTVTITEADKTVDDADFNADVTTIGGTAD